MRFVCEDYLQLMEKAVSGDADSIWEGKFVLDFLNQITGYYPNVKFDKGPVWNNDIPLLCGNEAKLFGIVFNIHQPTLQEVLERVLGVAATLEFSA